MKRFIRAVFVASAAALVLAPAILATTGGGTVYWDRDTCQGTETSVPAGTVTFSRDGKWLGGSVSLSNGAIADGTYGMLVFATNAGTCPSGKGVFVGQVNVSGGVGSATLNTIKILGNRDGHDVTVVLCIGGNSSAPGFHFSQPVTLGP